MVLRNPLLSPALVSLAGREEALDCSGLYHPLPGRWKNHRSFSRLKAGNLGPHTSGTGCTCWPHLWHMHHQCPTPPLADLAARTLLARNGRSPVPRCSGGALPPFSLMLPGCGKGGVSVVQGQAATGSSGLVALVEGKGISSYTRSWSPGSVRLLHSSRTNWVFSKGKYCLPPASLWDGDHGCIVGSQGSC